MGALVDRVKPVIPVELFHRIFPGVAVATMHLNCQAVSFETITGRPGLDHRREQVEQPGSKLTLLASFRKLLLVHQYCTLQTKRQPTFYIDLLSQQHTPDISMTDQRHLGAFRILFSNRTPLLPLAGILKRMKIAGVTQDRKSVV